MRPIKFRAWDKNHKVMFLVDELCLNYEGGICVTADRQDKRFLAGYACLCPLDVELMQFTGLLDKNSREIYEGDVLSVKFFDGCTARGKNKYVFGNYIVVWQQNRMGFGLTECAGKRICVDSWVFIPANDFEIIGNIFENPELLKDKSDE